MDTNELILRIVEALEKQSEFPQWDSIIQILSLIAAWIAIIFLLVERKNKNRPYLQISYELVRSSLACIVIRNVGESPLEVETINLSEEFVRQLPNETQERANQLKNTRIKIFPKRYYVFSLNVITGKILKEYETTSVVIDYKYKKIGNIIKHIRNNQ